MNAVNPKSIPYIAGSKKMSYILFSCYSRRQRNLEHLEFRLKPGKIDRRILAYAVN